MAVNTKERRTFSRRQRIMIAINVSMMIGIAGAIFLGVCYLASLPVFRARADLTKAHSFTLSPLTLRLVSSMEKDVEVISIYRTPYIDFTGLSRVEKEIGTYAEKLLEEYVILSGGRIHLEVLDRDRDNLRVRELNQEIGLSDQNVMIFRCGKNRTDVLPEDMASIDRGGVDPATNVIRPAQLESFKVEAAITFAIQSVIEEKKPKVYVTTGRSESNIEDSGPEGLFYGSDMLKRLNFEVEELRLYADLAVPEDCTVLVIPGPKDDFSGEEIAAIRSYLQSGGRLFLALAPRSTASLDEVLVDFNISPNREITCLERSVPLSQEERYKKSFLQTKWFSSESRITRSIADRELFGVFFMAGAVNYPPDDINVQVLVLSPKESWGDTHPPGGEGDWFCSTPEKRGQRVLGVSCEGHDTVKGARLVFLADTYSYTNDPVRNGRVLTGLDLFTNAVNWLAARENLLEIPPKSLYVSQVDLTEEEYHQIGLYVVIIIPGIAALAGLVVWWLRRR
jgi:hypothetical protein